MLGSRKFARGRLPAAVRAESPRVSAGGTAPSKDIAAQSLSSVPMSDYCGGELLKLRLGLGLGPTDAPPLLGSFPLSYLEAGDGSYKLPETGRVEIDRRSVIVALYDDAVTVLQVTHVLSHFEGHHSLFE
jgi:hypothetical protein